MAGRGPSPKDPSRRVRRNPDPVPMKVIQCDPASQPDLPTFLVEEDGNLVEFQWPAVTQEWWAMWGDSPLSDDFMASDWSFLLDTAVLHAKFWSGVMSAAPELRLRVAKFGATPEDRARLRIQFAQADVADEQRGTRKTATSKGRYPGLKLAE